MMNMMNKTELKMDELEQVNGGNENGFAKAAKIFWGWINDDPESTAIFKTLVKYGSDEDNSYPLYKKPD